LVFFHLSKLLFLSFLQFKMNFATFEAFSSSTLISNLQRVSALQVYREQFHNIQVVGQFFPTNRL